MMQILEEIKKCTKCWKYLLVSEFHNKNGTASKRKSHCKQCRSKEEHVKYIKIKEKFQNNSLDIKEKQCSKCKKVKSIDNFGISYPF